MDLYAELREQARKKRDKTIKLAQEEYNRSLAQIRDLRETLTGPRLGRPPGARNLRRQNDAPFYQLRVSEAVEAVLREGPKTVAEMVAEIQRRGCRAADHPRQVAAAVRGTLIYQKLRYKRVDKEKWALVADSAAT